MKKILLILMFLVIWIPLFSGGQPENKEPPVDKESRVTVFTSILPQKYFVERIGGDRVEINVLVGPGKNPATYEPAPSQVVALSQADLFFTVGVPFEQAFIGNIESSLPELNIVDTYTNYRRTILSEGVLNPLIALLGAVSIIKKSVLPVKSLLYKLRDFL